MCPDWACRRDVRRPPRDPSNCSVRDEGDTRWPHVTLCRFPARGSGALASRDEHMTRLERWITATVAGRGDPGERQLLHRYAVWHALRRLRRSAGGLDLATARQGDLDTWLTSEHTARHVEAGTFVRWARRQKLTSLDFAATRWDGPSSVIDPEARWRHARRLL